jgi:general nucleoside transport system permease protein
MVPQEEGCSMIEQFISITFLTGFLGSTIRMATPIIIVALGEMITERSGIMNLGIEGIVWIGAFTGFAATVLTGSLAMGFLVGGLSGIALGLLMSVVSIEFHGHQIVAGLGIWILCNGLSGLLNRRIFGLATVAPSIIPLPTIPIPGLSNIPILGETLFNQNIIVYLTILAIPLINFFFKETSWGLNIDAVGEQPRAADAAGLKVGWIRTLSASFGGFLAGIGGAYLPLALYSIYTNDISTGLGWMAIVVLVFGRWRPWGILGGALIFGAANALKWRLQNTDLPLPYQITLMLPYLVTLLMVIFFVRGGKGPSALATPYIRSEN